VAAKGARPGPLFQNSRQGFALAAFEVFIRLSPKFGMQSS
jgi:hypothetical protein